MSRPGPEPRINSKLLSKYVGQTVRLTGKVVEISGDVATIESSDGGQKSEQNDELRRWMSKRKTNVRWCMKCDELIGQVGVHLSREMHLGDKYVEIIGTVKDDLTLKGLLGFNMGDTLDLKAVNALVELAQTHKGAGILAA